MKRYMVDEDMIMWAFRYALGRRTGAVYSVIEHLKEYWSELEPFTQDQIKREINDAIRLYRTGDECDTDAWMEVLDYE